MVDETGNGEAVYNQVLRILKDPDSMPDGLEPEISQLVALLVRNNRIGQVKFILHRFIEFYNISRGRHVAMLKSAVPAPELEQRIKDLLQLVDGIDVVEPKRHDECCGFGGMFSIEETAVCAQMGKDKVERHMQTGAEYITGPDCSCLMHMAGVAKKQGLDIKFKHVVEILAAGL